MTAKGYSFETIFMHKLAGCWTLKRKSKDTDLVNSVYHDHLLQPSDWKRYLLSGTSRYGFASWNTVSWRKIDSLKYQSQKRFRIEKDPRVTRIMKLLYVCILFGLIFVSGIVMSAPEDRGIYFFKAGNLFPESNLDYARIIMNKLI